MSKRQQTIERTLDELVSEGHLSAEQRGLVAARLDVALNSSRVDFTAVVAGLGALLIAAGLLYLVGYNWEQLGKSTKLALIFGVWAGLHFAGWRLAEHPGGHPRVGRAFTLAGVLAFGGAIGLVAQIYNLSSHYPNAVLMWWALSVPVALVTRSRAVLVAVMALALIWAGWHLGIWIEDLPSDNERDWLANYTLVAAALAALLSALAAWADDSRFDTFAGVLRAPLVPAAALAPFVLAFHEPWRPSASSWRAASDLAAAPDLREALVRTAPVWLSIALAAAACGVLTQRKGAASLRFAWILVAQALLLALTVVLAPRWTPVIANVVLFGGALLVIALASRVGRGKLASAGVLVFVTGVVARYFEYLWDKLEGAYAFLATGALLMGAAWVFENRRRALRSRREQRTP